MSKVLSLIIPYHNSLELTKELLRILVPQLTDECELIIIDDDRDTTELDNYTSDKVRVIHNFNSNGTAGLPRNIGLDNKTKGTYITFIDSDDMVSEDYIKKILNKIKTSEFDYCLFSWKFNGQRNEDIIITEEAPEWNYSCWNCIYKDTDERFREDIKIGEDGEFNVRTRKGKRENITDILYLYTDNRKGSLTDVK